MHSRWIITCAAPAFATTRADVLARFFAVSGKAKSLFEISGAAWAKPMFVTINPRAVGMCRQRFTGGAPVFPMAARALSCILAHIGKAQRGGSPTTLDSRPFHPGQLRQRAL